MATLLATAAGAEPAKPRPRRFSTYANPIDLPYRYQPPFREHYREAADPTVVRFKGRYWMFPSHSLGYWWSKDLLRWTFVAGHGYALGKYAPTVIELGGRLYLAAGDKADKIWVTEDPMTGLWTEAADVSPGYDDPDLFLDDDGRLYMYEGLSGKGVLRVHELDPKTFQRLRSVEIPQSRDKANRGWEVPGDHNEQVSQLSYVEGSWVTKHGGRYYLQYAAPGTQLRTYADGVLVADHPMGPFAYQSYSPFSVKPTGFISGAGHSSTFQAVDGRWWHASTLSISKRHPFERRLGLFPASFAPSGALLADTYLGDYPHYIDGDRGLTGWMLLSRKKAVSASTTLPGFPAERAVDEDVRTWWSARTGDAGEWFQIDLGARKTIQAVQINFADQDSQGSGISSDGYRYLLEVSDDGQRWRRAIDKSTAARDAPHDYEVLAAPVRARFVRITNLHMPDNGKFSLYDLRVFGAGGGAPPAAVRAVIAARDTADARRLHVSWPPAKRAEFYVVRLGVSPALLNQNYQVYDDQTSVDVASLNVGVGYCVAIDAVNENGVTRGGTPTCSR